MQYDSLNILRKQNPSREDFWTLTVQKHLKAFFKKYILKNFAKVIEKRLCRNVFLIKLTSFFKKENPAQMFSFEIDDIFKNTFITECLQVTPSNSGF